MLNWAVTFFIIAIVAAVFGFGGIAASAAGIAQMLFWVFVALFVVAVVMGVFVLLLPRRTKELEFD